MLAYTTRVDKAGSIEISFLEVDTTEVDTDFVGSY